MVQDSLKLSQFGSNFFAFALKGTNYIIKSCNLSLQVTDCPLKSRSDLRCGERALFGSRHFASQILELSHF